jgi:hypothetical protein
VNGEHLAIDTVWHEDIRIIAFDVSRKVRALQRVEGVSAHKLRRWWRGFMVEVGG